MDPEASLELKAAPEAPPAVTDCSELPSELPESTEVSEEEEERTAMAPQESAEAQGPEVNGAVKLKIPDGEEEEQGQFTGLNKEELLRVAGTPGWVRTRWALLVLFWLSWIGMLAGAVLIILKAPQCKELPKLQWWNQGPLYRIRSIKDFTHTGNIKGVEQQLGYLSELKVKGLVLGPIHVAPKDDPLSLGFEEVSAESGSLDQMKNLLQRAHKRGLFVVLDLSPNYLGADVWFSNSSIGSVAERLKSALVFWLTLGVDGVKLDSVDSVWTQVPAQWSDIRAIVQNWTDSRPHKRLLLGSTSLSSPSEVSALLEDSGVDLLMSPVLSAQTDSTERAQTVQLLSSAHGPTQLLWSLEPLGGAEEKCARSELLLLFTLPGTPLIQSGDEIGLRAAQGDKFPRMLWDSDQEQNQNQTQDISERSSCRLFISSLSTLRARERSLLFGDFGLVYNSSSVLVFLRSWDQSPRFLVLVNSGTELLFTLADAEGALKRVGGAEGGATAKVLVSSNSSALSPESELSLNQVQVGPGEAVLLLI